MLATSILFIGLLTIYSQQSTADTTVNHLSKRSVIPLPEYTAFKEGLKHGKLVCQLPLARGNCSKKFTRFYYDSTTEHCFKFVYTGCKGNGNRFLTKHQCKQRCSPNFWKHHNPTKLSATLVAKDTLPIAASSNSSTNSQNLAEVKSLKTSQLQCDQQKCNSTNHGKCVNGKCRCFKGFEMRDRKCVGREAQRWKRILLLQCLMIKMKEQMRVQFL